MEKQQNNLTYAESVKRGLHLLGSFCIASVISIMLHEMGHLGFAWVTNGQVSGIRINPFSWSYSNSSSPYPILHTASGSIGASFLGLLLFVLLQRWRNPWLFPLLLAGPLSLIHNGSYWILDKVFASGGDACSLSDKGIPTIVIFGTGFTLLMGGLLLAYHLFRKVGLLNSSLKRRLLIMAIGIVPYFIGMLTWNYLFNRQEMALWGLYSCIGIASSLFVAVMPVWYQARDVKKCPTMGWGPIIGINIIAWTIIAILLIISRTSKVGSNFIKNMIHSEETELRRN